MAAVKVWNQTIDPGKSMAGTLTCVLQLAHSPARWMAVSAAHVLAPLVAGSRLPPGSGDQVVFEAGGNTFTGSLWYWCDLQREVEGFTNEFDAALVEVSAADAQALQGVMNQPATWADPAAGSPVAFDGITSRASSGHFQGQHTTAVMDYAVLGGTFAGVTFKDSLRADLSARPGDSGALVTSGGCGVGLLVGSEGELARFLPLAPMLRCYGLAWQRDPGAAPPALPAPPPAMYLPLLPDVITGDAPDTLARTLWGEARGEPLRGIRAVAAVILNRAVHPRVHWWGATVVGVCRAPWQFSCWNANDPNRAKLLAVTTADSHFKACLDVAQEALAGQLAAEQQLQATHYHTKSVRPKWARNKVPCADIGAHLFYNDIE